jgi:AraC-like DNA-binding protein
MSMLREPPVAMSALRAAAAALDVPQRAHHAGHGAAFAINVTPVERILRRSDVVALGEFRCPVDHPQFAGGGPQACPYIVFSRSSVRIAPLDGKPEVRTPNIVGLYNVGDVYARQAISAEGDRCDWIALAPQVLRDIGARLDPELGDGRNRIFARRTAPAPTRLYLDQRRLFRALHDDAHLSMLEVEECSIAIAEAALASALYLSPGRRRRRRNAAGSRAPAIVDATRAILAREFASPLLIGDIAKRVHCSPGYLSRLFRNLTGFSLHDYQQQLRLRSSLALLLDARRDLSGLAVLLGYANHSHFSSVFRRQFGITPTEFAQRRSLSVLRESGLALDDAARAAARRATSQNQTGS